MSEAADIAADAAILFVGEVVHTRVRPRPHKLRYSVFNILIDIDRIQEVADRVPLISYNAPNLVAFYDRDLGDRSPTPICQRIRRDLAQSNLAHAAATIRLLAYPRVFGSVFNPLSVYFCYTAEHELAVLVYEVSNTYGERKSYILPVEASAPDAAEPTIWQSCQKELSVSPFTHGSGWYNFHVRPPASEVVVGVALQDDAGPILKTHFKGRSTALTSAAILRQFCRTPLLTQRVLGAIHLEAAKLWWKGVPVVRRHRSPAYSVSTPNGAGDA